MRAIGLSESGALRVSEDEDCLAFCLLNDVCTISLLHADFLPVPVHRHDSAGRPAFDHQLKAKPSVPRLQQLKKGGRAVVVVVAGGRGDRPVPMQVTSVCSLFRFGVRGTLPLALRLHASAGILHSPLCVVAPLPPQKTHARHRQNPQS